MNIRNFLYRYSGVRNLKCLCSVSLCCVYGLINLTSRLLLMVLICGVFEALCFESCGWVSFFYSSFPVTTRRLDPFSGTYLKQLQLLRCRVKEYFDLRGPPGEVLLYLKMEAQPASEISCLFKI